MAPALREFREILELGRVRAVYQPIVNLRSGSVFAWEALARGPVGTTLASPAMLFDVAEEAGALVVDKPPFLPSTPNGRLVRNTVLQLRGIDTYKEFIKRHRELMERGDQGL